MPRDAPKPEQQRAREAEMIRVQLEDLGFPEEALTDIREALREFVQGYGLTKTYRFPELGVAVLLLLSLQPRITSYARVRKL